MFSDWLVCIPARSVLQAAAVETLTLDWTGMDLDWMGGAAMPVAPQGLEGFTPWGTSRKVTSYKFMG